MTGYEVRPGLYSNSLDVPPIARTTPQDVVYADGSKIQSPASLPAVSTLTDDFSTQNTIKWRGWGAGVTQTNNQLHIAASNGYPALTSESFFSLIDSSVVVQLVQRPDLADGSTEALLRFNTDATNGIALLVSGNNFVMREVVGGTSSDVYQTYEASHTWMRISHSSATNEVKWDTSADGVNWTNRRTRVTTANYRTGYVILIAGNYNGVASPGTAIWDNVNLPPAEGLPAGSATISLTASGSASVGPNALLSLHASGYNLAPGTLIFEDNFDGAAGSSINSTYWNINVGPGYNFGNNELEYYQEANVTKDGNGNLRLQARVETVGSNSYTSGRVTTRDKFEQTYGKFEARIKVPKGQGLWPAFWMMQNEDSYGPWPAAGEIDILEAVNQMDYLEHTIHGPTQADPSVQWFINMHWTPKVDISADFHIYAVEWARNVMRFYFDNEHVATFTPEDMPAGNSWVWNDRPMYMLLNLAVGGTMPGQTVDTGALPADMLIDYVRVYSPGTYAPFRPAFTSLKSDFSTKGELQDNWTANLNNTGNTLNIIPTSSYPGTYSERQFSLVDSSVLCQLVSPPAVGNGSIQTAWKVKDQGVGGGELEIGWTNNNIYCNNNGSANYYDYNSTNHKYLRIRHSSATDLIYWEYSPDNVTWTAFQSAPRSIPIVDMRWYISAGYYGTESTVGTAVWDNLNAAAPAPSAAGSAAISLTASGAAQALVSAGTASLSMVASGSGQANSTGSASIALTATGTARASATGVASINLVASGNARAATVGTANLALSASGSARATAIGTATFTLSAAGNASTPVLGTASLSLLASGSANGDSSGNASLSLIASGASQAPGAGSAALSLTGNGAASATAIGSASISLIASGNARGVSTGSATLALTASGSSSAASTGSASLSLTASGAARAAATGSATIALTANGSSAAVANGSASINLVAVGTTGSTGLGTAAVVLTASGSSSGATSAGANLSLTASGVGQASATGSATFLLTASGGVDSSFPATGEATLSLIASGNARATAVGSASLSLAASGSARAQITGSAGINLVASGSARVPVTPSALFALTATGSAAVPATANAMITINAAGSFSLPGLGAASINLTASGQGRASQVGTALVTITAAGTVRAGASGTASINLTVLGNARVSTSASSMLQLIATAQLGAMAQASALLALRATGNAYAQLDAVKFVDFTEITPRIDFGEITTQVFDRELTRSVSWKEL